MCCDFSLERELGGGTIQEDVTLRYLKVSVSTPNVHKFILAECSNSQTNKHYFESNLNAFVGFHHIGEVLN